MTVVLAKHFHDAASMCNVVINGNDLFHEGTILDIEDVGEAIRVRLVGAHEAEIGLLFVASEDIAQHFAKHTRGL